MRGLVPVFHWVLAVSPHLTAGGQTFWTPAGFNAGLAGMYHATYGVVDGQRTYIGGWRDFDPDQSGWQNMLIKITSAGIEYVPVHGGFYSIVEFHDTLYLGGSFSVSPGDISPARNIQYLSDTGWVPSGVFNQGNVRSLRVLDDTLYAVGSFTEVDGLACTGMIRLVNGTWQPLPHIPEPDIFGDAILDIIKFNDKLIASGNIIIGDQDGIAYLEEGQWHILGHGLEAGFSSVNAMLIYQDDLYLGGQIAITENNPGRGIMRWDGTQFHALGAVGLQRDLGDDSGLGTVGGMVVHDGLLYVGGTFRYAGGVPAKGMATWDGTEWCSVPGNLSDGDGHNGVRGAAFFQDTLFVICGPMADGDSVNLAAKFIGDSYAGPCTSDVGLPETSTTSSFIIFPNPATTRIRFTPPLDRSEQISITDALGRIVVRLSGQVTELDVSAWPRGLYMIGSATRAPTRFVLH